MSALVTGQLPKGNLKSTNNIYQHKISAINTSQLPNEPKIESVKKIT